MEGTRKRRSHAGRDKKKVSFTIPDDSSAHHPLIGFLVQHKFYIFGLICSILILTFMLWPAPRLSKHAQHWHDSGFILKHRQHSIFYQDIFRISTEEADLQPVALILHGFPTSSYDWKKLVNRLHARFARIIIPDMLGFGFSDKPLKYEYSIKEQATIQEKLLEKLNVTDVHILAHDYGDTVAQELLARTSNAQYKLRIKSICLTNGGIIPSQHHPRPIQKALMTPILNTILSMLSNRVIFNSRFRAIFGPHTQPSAEDLNDFWAIVRHNGGHMAFSQILQYIPERHANEQRWVGALKSTGVPLHLIYGALDPVNTPDGFFREYKKLIPHSSYTMLENVGHYPQLEDEAGFMKSYNEFLNRVEKTFYTL